MPGGTSKQKITSRPILPQPMSGVPLNTSITASGQFVRAQHSRGQAFVPPSVRSVAVPLSDTEAGPSRREPSPPKDLAFAVSVSILSSKAGPTRPALSKTATAEPVRPSEPPFPLGHCGRSVSHDVLSVTTIHSLGPSSPNDTTRHNPLSRPSRPHLSSSFSSVSLPGDASEIVPLAPHRRFAPPTRIVRPTPLPEESSSKDEAVDYFSHVPTGTINLSGPQRLPVTGQGERWVAVGPGKRPTVLGQAHRRAVTAPGGIIDGTKASVQIPGLASSVLRRSVKEYPNEIEEAVPNLQVSSSDKTDVLTSISPTHIAPTPVDSPLLPVMVSSTTTDTTASSESSKTAAEDEAEDLMKMEEEAADLTELEVGIEKIAPTVEVFVQDASDPQGEFKTDRASESALPDTTWTPIDDRIGSDSDPGNGTTRSPAQSRIESEIESVERSRQIDNAEPPTMTSSITEPLPALMQNDLPVAPKLTASFQSTQAARSQLLSHPSIESRKTASTVDRSSGSGPKDRKPFKPTIRPAAGSAVPAKQVLGGPAIQKSATNANKAVASKPPTLTKPTIATASVPTSAQPASKASSYPPKLVNKANVMLAVGVTKPTASSTAKASAKQERSAPPIKPSLPPTKIAHDQITLPPMRKERVRLKPPLPSFVPTRGKGKAAMGASTSSSVGKVTVEKSAIIAKVRPENIPLPLSPTEKAKLGPTHIPLPRSPLAAESYVDSPEKRSPFKHVPGMSPCSVVPSKPLSPVLTTKTSLRPPESPTVQMAKLTQISTPTPHFISLTLDQFDSSSSASASSKGRIVPRVYSDTENEDDTNSARDTPRQPWSRKFLVGHLIDQDGQIGLSTSPKPAQASRSDVVTPAKSAQVSLAKVSGSTTPVGTPRSGRTPLKLRDANQS